MAYGDKLYQECHGYDLDGNPVSETAPTTRTIENSDLWSAIRGLGMYRMDRAELQQLIAHHAAIDPFASRVIAEAARQVLASKPRNA